MALMTLPARQTGGVIPGPTQPGIVPMRGVLPADQAAANRAPTGGIINTPTFVKPGEAAAVGTQQYKDQFGRTAVGLVDNQGRVIKDMAPPKPVTPTTPTTPTAVLPTDPRPSQITGGHVDSYPHPTLSLDNLSGILGVANVAVGTYNLITDNLANSGVFSGLLNGIDQFGADLGIGFSTPGFTGGTSAGGTTTVSIGNPGSTTLTNAIGYGSFGGFTANLLGLSSGNALLDMGGSIAGGVAGGAVGSSIGGSIAGIGAGAIGAFVGGFAVVALMAAFRGKPSNKEAGGIYDAGSKGVLRTWTAEGGKYSQENNNGRDSWLRYAGDLQTNLATTFGGQNSPRQYGIYVGSRDGMTVAVNETKVKVQNGQEALELMGKDMLRHTSGWGQDMELVRQTLNWDALNFNQAVGALGFARDFRGTVENFANGRFNIDQRQEDAIATVDTWANRARDMYSKPGISEDLMAAYTADIDRAVLGAKNRISDYYRTNSTPQAPPPRLNQAPAPPPADDPNILAGQF